MPSGRLAPHGQADTLKEADAFRGFRFLREEERERLRRVVEETMN